MQTQHTAVLPVGVGMVRYDVRVSIRASLAVRSLCGRHWPYLVITLLVLGLVGAAAVRSPGPAAAQEVAFQPAPVPLGPGSPVPEFPADAAWLNTDRPLTLRGLRGKIVLLDFWTYGCINCIHILPDLKALERKYPDELVIVSVHTAKFPNEDVTANLRNAVLRYNIEHPILNDSGQRYWNALGIQMWPTQVLIDPLGRLVGAVAGEGHAETVDRAVARVAREARAGGWLDPRPVQFALEAARVPETPLWYPGKVLADLGPDGTGRIYIADSNHHRIVIANERGEVEAVAGSGIAGREDGPFDTAQFFNPQGMSLRRAADGSKTLLVADTGNHVIRELDLMRGTVTTLAGTGRQAPPGRVPSGGPALRTALSSPWDLLLVGSRLYIAMAGPHQIWMMDLDSGRVSSYAGSGKEARTDGILRSAAFAQPSGLATDGKRLFVADSETSTIRSVDLPGGTGRVRTLVMGDLFDFGDRDGAAMTARLQHPLGVAYDDGRLFIADTYNHKLKVLDLETGIVETFLGAAAGSADGANPQFYEPGGLSLAGRSLYVADTNNHRIRVVDLETRMVSTLALKNLPRPLPAEPDRSPRPTRPEEVVEAPLQRLAPNQAGELHFQVKLPPGHKLADDSPHRFEAQVEGEGLTLPETRVSPEKFTLPLRLPLTSAAIGGQGAVVITATVFYCSDEQLACRMKTVRIRAPFEIAEGGSGQLAVTAD
jgi:thiol-disulfide isomerase/thioredoxin